ncbi:MAG: hypothetical protein CMN27_09460 [Salinisphaera sp.]|nr:hypothetical protein [Salinisphaera sp.]
MQEHNSALTRDSRACYIAAHAFRIGKLLNTNRSPFLLGTSDVGRDSSRGRGALQKLLAR